MCVCIYIYIYIYIYVHPSRGAVELAEPTEPAEPIESPIPAYQKGSPAEPTRGGGRARRALLESAPW